MRAICTSASLQASTWVSPGFTLFRHSSPPFGSKQAHSDSTHKGPAGVETYCTPSNDTLSVREKSSVHFSLARLFDSLVRVSRRVKAPHFQCQVNSEHHLKESTRGAKGFLRRARSGHRSVLHFSLFKLALPVPLVCTLLTPASQMNSMLKIMLRWSALTE